MYSIFWMLKQTSASHLLRVSTILIFHTLLTVGKFGLGCVRLMGRRGGGGKYRHHRTYYTNWQTFSPVSLERHESEILKIISGGFWSLESACSKKPSFFWATISHNESDFIEFWLHRHSSHDILQRERLHWILTTPTLSVNVKSL